MSTQTDTQDLVSLLTDFEEGQLNSYDTLQLFGGLISTGTINSLQGYYQRTARDLVDAVTYPTKGTSYEGKQASPCYEGTSLRPPARGHFAHGHGGDP